MRNASFILATDLDGTFLAGTERARGRMVDLFGARSSKTHLVFVTGRGLETVLPVLSDPLVPTPDFIVADVGSTVVRTDKLEPVNPLQTEIAARWPGTHRVLRALEPFTALRRQEVPQERRCSFLLESPELPAGLEEAVAALGCELLRSAGRYLDVLPRGVSKGSTLLGLARALGWDPARILVAGDTLNDLSMYETGLKGVVVGEAEPALIEAVKGRTQVHVAREPGAGGILEGLSHHGFLPTPPVAPTRAFGDAELVMVYHRLPFDEHRAGGKTERRRPASPNGIIPTLLGFFADGRPGSWVGWSQQATRQPDDFETHVAVDRQRYPRLRAARVPLTAEDVSLFYKRFSKEAFWPIIFSFTDRAEFRQDHWDHYVAVNRLFAEQAAREAAEGALVWIHDYNLWLVPGQLRQLRPDLRIAFFHHTAFPSPDVFNVLPWRREIVGSLLQCDYVGFHIPRFVENFVGVLRSYAPTTLIEHMPCAPRYRVYGCALGVDGMTTELEVGGRRLRLGANPVGIDVTRLGELVRTPQMARRIEVLRRDLGDRACVLSIERLDYVKGPLEKLLAFERLLEERPELRGEVVLLNVVTPPADGMAIYSSTKEEVDKVVGRINGRFSKMSWTPVHYFYRSLPYEEVLAHYAVADVAWITPLRDGLNLVAKEYVATKAATGGRGALVLSEFAGAAVELHGALLTNPYDAANLADTLYDALSLEPEDAAYRLRRLIDIVKANDVHRWGRDFLRAVDGDLATAA